MCESIMTSLSLFPLPGVMFRANSEYRTVIQFSSSKLLTTHGNKLPEGLANLWITDEAAALGS